MLLDFTSYRCLYNLYLFYIAFPRNFRLNKGEKKMMIGRSNTSSKFKVKLEMRSFCAFNYEMRNAVSYFVDIVSFLSTQNELKCC